MTWEQQLAALFDDLEQQAEGLALAVRAAEVADQARSEYAEIDLAARWHASLGSLVDCSLRGGTRLRGRLVRAGAGWALVRGDTAEVLVAADAVLALRGLATTALPEAARPVTSRLRLASALRRLAEEQQPVVVLDVEGAATGGRLRRVGADFVELAPEGQGAVVVPFRAIAAVRSR